jgi:flavin reductase (DIM6/NTAB) family NADH-FMN oxidoreductase RutF
MPTLLVAVRTGEGSANVLTIAWAGIVGGSPPMMALEIAPNHYSTPFIEREGNFTANIPRSTQAVEADYCGLVSGRKDPDKAGTCGFTLVPSTNISSPLIAECPLNMECRLLRRVEAGKGSFFLAEILETHVDEAALDEAGQIDALRLDPLIFGANAQYYRLGGRVAKAFEVGKALRK